jgi:hypothetical protein
MVPLALKKFGADPATASSIVVTTFTDVGCLLVFLGLAALLIENRLQLIPAQKVRVAIAVSLSICPYAKTNVSPDRPYVNYLLLLRLQRH